MKAPGSYETLAPINQTVQCCDGPTFMHFCRRQLVEAWCIY